VCTKSFQEHYFRTGFLKIRFCPARDFNLVAMMIKVLWLTKYILNYFSFNPY